MGLFVFLNANTNTFVRTNTAKGKIFLLLFHSATIERFAPFRGMIFFFIGKKLKDTKNLKKRIEQWGGSVASKLTANVVAIISTEGEYKS